MVCFVSEHRLEESAYGGRMRTRTSLDVGLASPRFLKTRCDESKWAVMHSNPLITVCGDVPLRSFWKCHLGSELSTVICKAVIFRHAITHQGTMSWSLP